MCETFFHKQYLQHYPPSHTPFSSLSLSQSFSIVILFPNPMSSHEPLLSIDSKRRSLFPLQYPEVFERYRRTRAMFWAPGEVDLSADVAHWKALHPDERHFLSLVLAFFSVADSIVNENLAERFGKEVTIYEAQCFYNFQQAMEDIHSEMYSLLIDTYISSDAEKERLTNAIENFPCIKRKTDWAIKWIHSDRSFAERLVAFAVVEGIFFQGSFCSIFYMKQKGILPGLAQANELIARDEAQHQEFAVLLYSLLQEKLPDQVVYDIVDDAVQAEIEFCTEALPVDLIGMNSRHMAEYIRFVADRLVKQLGVPKLYNAVNRFAFMENQSLEGKTNFFERRVSEYRKAGAQQGVGEFTIAADF